MSFDKSKNHSQVMGGGLTKWSQNGKMYDRDFKEIAQEVAAATEVVAPAVQLKSFKPTPEPTAPMPESPVAEVVPAPETPKTTPKPKKEKAKPFGARDE